MASKRKTFNPLDIEPSKLDTSGRKSKRVMKKTGRAGSGAKGKA